jgi:hypothetical protein
VEKEARLEKIEMLIARKKTKPERIKKIQEVKRKRTQFKIAANERSYETFNFK